MGLGIPEISNSFTEPVCGSFKLCRIDSVRLILHRFGRLGGEVVKVPDDLYPAEVPDVLVGLKLDVQPDLDWILNVELDFMTEVVYADELTKKQPGFTGCQPEGAVTCRFDHITSQANYLCESERIS